MLQEDTRSFLDFFAEIKETTAKASQQLEALKKDRHEKTQNLQKINDECSGMSSQMNKNLEQLLVLQQYKNFLDKLKQQDPGFQETETIN